MSIQHITKYNGSKLCEFCGECRAEIESIDKDIKQKFCRNCFFGTNKNIVLPIDVISQHFHHKCNDCDKSSKYKLENETQTTYYCDYHICPGGPSIECVPE